MACRRESGFKDTKIWWIISWFFSVFSGLCKQPCHASLSAHVIPTLGSAAMSCQPFCPCHPHVGLSSHVMPTLACAREGIYGCWSCLFCSAIRKEEGRLSHTLGKVLARCWHTQPYPLSMARAKEGRRKSEGSLCLEALMGVLGGSESFVGCFLGIEL